MTSQPAGAAAWVGMLGCEQTWLLLGLVWWQTCCRLVEVVVLASCLREVPKAGEGVPALQHACFAALLEHQALAACSAHTLPLPLPLPLPTRPWI